MTRTELAGMIEKHRLSLGMGQGAFGKLFNTSQQTVAGWEKGSVPNPSTLPMVCDVLGLDIDEVSKLRADRKKPKGIIPSVQAGHKHKTSDSPTDNTTSDDFQMSDMIQATIRVLESETIYKTALASNIRAFDDAVQRVKHMDDLSGQMMIMKDTMEAMREEIAMMREEMSADKKTPEKKLQGNDN